jgi:hypothetical protein
VISISQADSRGMHTADIKLTPPTWRNTLDRSASGTMSEMMTKNNMDTTGDEPAIKPCSADAQLQRMSKLCQNQ